MLPYGIFSYSDIRVAVCGTNQCTVHNVASRTIAPAAIATVASMATTIPTATIMSMTMTVATICTSCHSWQRYYKKDYQQNSQSLFHTKIASPFFILDDRFNIYFTPFILFKLIREFQQISDFNKLLIVISTVAYADMFCMSSCGYHRIPLKTL